MGHFSPVNATENYEWVFSLLSNVLFYGFLMMISYYFYPSLVDTYLKLVSVRNMKDTLIIINHIKWPNYSNIYKYRFFYVLRMQSFNRLSSKINFSCTLWKNWFIQSFMQFFSPFLPKKGINNLEKCSISNFNLEWN